MHVLSPSTIEQTAICILTNNCMRRVYCIVVYCRAKRSNAQDASLLLTVLLIYSLPYENIIVLGSNLVL